MDHQQYGSHATATAAARREAQQGEDSLSPLEQEVLDEYAKLVGNLDDVCLDRKFLLDQ
jgi:DASH complex subunit DAD3